MGVKPDDIKTEEDFNKIPLVLDTFFKSYPDIEENGGKNFLKWLDEIYTGELSKIELKKKKPSYDDVIEELAKKNVYLMFSTGTTGRFSFVPRDWITYSRVLFSVGSECQMVGSALTKDSGVAAFFPNPTKTYSWARKTEVITEVIYKGSERVYLIDRPLTTEIMEVMLRGKGIKGMIIKRAAALSMKKTMSKYIKYLKKCEKEGKNLFVIGYPATINMLLSHMEKNGIKFHFDNGIAAFGGGWKNQGGENMSMQEFYEKLNKYLGIHVENCRDEYGMNEMNVEHVECEFHYKHIPYFFQPYILDEEMNPLPYGEYGTFAFLDPLANSYPGFIITGDKVKLLEHCPECDRPGPVLVPEISRIEGAESKGCAEVSAKLLEEMRG
jgi:hypothetical protein